jgi:phosphoserine phosphatase RsbU/P
LGIALPSYVMDGATNQVLERRVRQLLLLQETAKKVNSILDLEKLLDEIVGRVAEAFGCNRTAVLLKDDARNDLEMIALRGFSNVHLKGYRFKVGGEGMVGHVSATAKMRYAPDVRKDLYYVVSESTTLSEVDIPLITRGKLIGIFNAQSSAVDAFSPEQIDLLCALADNIAIAIENARLFRRERLEKEKALHEQAEARQIQRALLPAQEPVISGYAVDGSCLQLNAVGGDWYDYLDLGDGFLEVSSRRQPAFIEADSVLWHARSSGPTRACHAVPKHSSRRYVLRHFPGRACRDIHLESPIQHIRDVYFSISSDG